MVDEAKLKAFMGRMLGDLGAARRPDRGGWRKSSKSADSRRCAGPPKRRST